MMLPDTPIQFVRGIGPRRSEQLAVLGIRTIEDLVRLPPFRYEDRTQFRDLASLREEEWVVTQGEICSISGFNTRRRGMSVVEILVRDGTGSVRLKFFNQPYLSYIYRTGLKLVIYGQVKQDSYAHGALCLMNPECEILEDEKGPSIHSGRIVPIYRKIADLRGRTLRQIMHSVISGLSAEIADPLPDYLRRQLQLMPRQKALAQIHFPDFRTNSAAEQAGELEALNQGLSPAHKRMIFEELFQLQVGIRMVRENRVLQTKERTIRIGDNVRQAIKRILPFHPTDAQKRVLKEIADDMCSPHPMNRLLQGDVGSGKTIVAAQAAIIAVENGHQVAIMAPTEILAEQHYFYFRRLLAPSQYTVSLITGSKSAKEKREVRDAIRSGIAQIAIGTHALIQEDVEFRSLGLVVVDEQHRFGVLQRNILKEKGNRPDMLVMTATPIPRSLALTLYGDLDVSVIDRLPPGRKPIVTRQYEEKDREQVYAEMKKAVATGHQVYVVYPLVEESEKTDLRAATEMAVHLKKSVFPDFRIGLLHGRMKGGEKEAVMSSFASGEIQVLVSTTVIEVGVDVGNATTMVIEHAERFGLAQLHQLRGRIGRGAAQSLCILITNARQNLEARQRLEIMCETNDGFRIADVDLKLRGPGEFIGTRQSGIPEFRFADIIRDQRALEIARTEADAFLRILRTRPDESCQRAALLIKQLWRDRFGLAAAG
jgi:ATP-dependent DNA helicase RecG